MQKLSLDKLSLNTSRMDFVYVVIENGDPYPVVYTRYEDAINAVKLKHKETLDEDLRWANVDGMHSVNVVDVPESNEGPSYLYIEKGIHIYIYKLPITMKNL